jgi:hypothetical protein
MKTQVEFKSKAFPKYENEGEEIINEHLWGKRLAEFVRDTLPQYGIQTKDIGNEDWGWMVDIQHDAFPVSVCCGIMDEPDDEEDVGRRQPGALSPGDPTQFTMFVAAEPGFFQKLFKKVDTKPVSQSVAAAMKRMVEDHPDKFIDPEWVDGTLGS